jgi:succinoglycan biosynthesis transport protein ExoP
MLVQIKDSDPGIMPSPNAPSGPARKGAVIDLTAVLGAVLRQKRIVLIAMGVALALGLLHVVTAPRVYMAATEVMIGDDVPGVSSGFNRPSGAAQDEVMLESALRVLQSQNLALAVVTDLELHKNEVFMDPPQSLPRSIVQGLRGLVAAVLPGGETDPQDGLSPEQADLNQRMEAAETLRESIEVRREGRSSVFLIRYSSSDPELVAAVINAYGEAFVSDQLIGNVEASARVLDWLQERLFVIQDNSTQAALRAEEYRARSGLETIAGEPITVQTIAQLKTDEAAATVELARLRALSKVYDDLRQLELAAFIQSGAAGALVQDAEFSAGQERLLGLQRRLDEVERRFGPDHIEVVQLRERIDMEGRALQREMQRLYDATQNAVRALETEIGILRSSIDEISEQNLDLATSRVELRALERQAEIYEALNEAYLLRLKDLEQTQTFPVTNVRVLSMADVPSSPVGPRKSLILGFMLVLGATAGVGLALWRERVQRFIRTREDLEAASGLPFLGYLPMLNVEETDGATEPETAVKPTRGGDAPRKAFKHEFAALKNPRSQFAETLRAIRIAVEASGASRTGYVLGVVSIRPGEGKTTTAANLAALAAVSGRSVLLVDADVRTSALSRKLRQSMGLGLRDVLTGRAALDGALRRETNTKLHFLPFTSSSSEVATGDLVGVQEFRTLMNEVRRRYDLTVIDLAPLGPVPDARALAPVLDGLVMVLEWGKVSGELLQDICSVDPVLYDKLIGIALNKTDMKALSRYSRAAPFEEYYDAYTEPNT